MVTVEADQVRVESRLTAGEVGCPGCPGVLAPWGWARRRRVRGVGSLRPRRARCGGCLVTHVLLPVTVLLRRADAVEVIGAALTARAAGLGHRRIAVWLGVPAGTVRGWLRRWGYQLEARKLWMASPVPGTAAQTRHACPRRRSREPALRHPLAARVRRAAAPRTRRNDPTGPGNPGETVRTEPGHPTSPTPRSTRSCNAATRPRRSGPSRPRLRCSKPGSVGARTSARRCVVRGHFRRIVVE